MLAAESRPAPPPKVTVVIPVFNGAGLIEQSVNSVLSQEYSNLEVLIVDDGSTDDLLRPLSGYLRNNRVRLLSHPGRARRGVSASRALGVQESQGEYIAFLDVDDAFLPSKVSLQVEAMEAAPSAVMCHGAIELISDCPPPPSLCATLNLGHKKLIYRFSRDSHFLRKNRICNSTALIRRRELQKIDWSVSSTFHFFEDWLLWVLLGERGPFIYLPQTLIQYRFHSGSNTYASDKDRVTEALCQIVFAEAVAARTRSSRTRILALLKAFVRNVGLMRILRTPH